jgi:hypothetical protein
VATKSVEREAYQPSRIICELWVLKLTGSSASTMKATRATALRRVTTQTQPARAATAKRYVSCSPTFSATLYLYINATKTG